MRRYTWLPEDPFHAGVNSYFEIGWDYTLIGLAKRAIEQFPTEEFRVCFGFGFS